MPGASAECAPPQYRGPDLPSGERMQERPRFVVVVEDEADLREAVVEYLTGMKLHAAGAASSAELRTIVAEHRVDLVILDIGLPGEDGLSVSRWLRRNVRCGIIMTTGADRYLDKMAQTDTRADEFLFKPYDLRDLLTRSLVLLQRIAGDPRTEPPRPTQDDIPTESNRVTAGQSFGPFHLDLAGRRLLRSDGADLGLSPTEFDLVCKFAEQPGRSLSRSALASLTDGRQNGQLDRRIDARVARLRRKLSDHGAGSGILVTVRREGYRYEPGTV